VRLVIPKRDTHTCSRRVWKVGPVYVRKKDPLFRYLDQGHFWDFFVINCYFWAIFWAFFGFWVVRGGMGALFTPTNIFVEPGFLCAADTYAGESEEDRVKYVFISYLPEPERQ